MGREWLRGKVVGKERNGKASWSGCAKLTPFWCDGKLRKISVWVWCLQTPQPMEHIHEEWADRGRPGMSGRRRFSHEKLHAHLLSCALTLMRFSLGFVSTVLATGGNLSRIPQRWGQHFYKGGGTWISVSQRTKELRESRSTWNLGHCGQKWLNASIPGEWMVTGLRYTEVLGFNRTRLC